MTIEIRHRSNADQILHTLNAETLRQAHLTGAHLLDGWYLTKESTP